MLLKARSKLNEGASEMALKPLHDRVLVRRVESDEKTAGGLIIPDSAKEKPAEGLIVAAGRAPEKITANLLQWP